MLKKIRKTISKFLYALPFGLKAGDEVITAPTVDGSEGAGIHQQKATNNVLNDLLEGRVTEEVQALRYSTFLVEERANDYKYVGGGRAKRVEKPKSIRKFKMGNIDLDYTGEESLELLYKEKCNLTMCPTRKAIQVTNRDSVTRFKLDGYINSICVNLDSNPMTIELRFENDMRSRLMRPFINHLRDIMGKLNEGKEEVVKKTISNEDVLSGIEKIEFTTYGCSNNIPNGIHYALYGIKFKEIKDEVEFVSIVYTVDRYEDGKKLSEQYYSEKQDKRYKNKEAKPGAAALIDIANANKSLEGKDKQDPQSTGRHNNL